MDDLHTDDTSPGENAFTRNFSEWVGLWPDELRWIFAARLLFTFQSRHL